MPIFRPGMQSLLTGKVAKIRFFREKDALYILQF